MEQNYELEYFFTAFVDVLGQRERLRQLRGLPTTDEEMEKTVAVLRETAGFVLWLRKTFLRFFEACNASTGTFNALAPQQRQLAAELMHSEVQCRGVSDSIIITVSLTNTDEHCTPMNGVHDALVAVSAMFLSALSVRHPVRGGIDVGVGLTLGPEEVYGAALERAYFLESVRAEYPRVVCGDELWSYLSAVEAQHPTTLHGQWAKKIAKDCKKLLTQDSDCQRILDYLGPGIPTSVLAELSSEVGKAHDFARTQLSLWQAKNNDKLALRYQRLCDYLSPRISQWGSVGNGESRFT